MKIVYYTQHVLGIGHLYRSLAVVEALAGHDVILVTGGPEAPRPRLREVRELRLEPLMMDAEFSRLSPVDPGLDLAAVKAERARALYDLFEAERPDWFVVELYPFGRKAFRFELDPVLETIRSGLWGRCRTVCGLRDILVEKKDQAAYEARVVDLIGRYFDAILVHADPNLIPLEATFGRAAELADKIAYTGYVTPRPAPGSGRRARAEMGLGADDALIVVSAGGGKVGGELLEAAIRARAYLKRPARMVVLTGPFVASDRFRRLEGLAGGEVEVRRFSDDFLSLLDAADLSVSMAGYNTTLNLLAARTRGLVRPFDQNREQRLRSEALAARGVLKVLEEKDVADGRRLARLMAEGLDLGPPPDAGLELDGAARTARWLEQWAGS
jgi:predicted glycosyltransferase